MIVLNSRVDSNYLLFFGKILNVYVRTKGPEAAQYSQRVSTWRDVPLDTKLNYKAIVAKQHEEKKRPERKKIKINPKNCKGKKTNPNK